MPRTLAFILVLLFIPNLCAAQGAPTAEAELARKAAAAESEEERAALVAGAGELLNAKLVDALKAEGSNLGRRGEALRALSLFRLALGVAEKLDDQSAVNKLTYNIGFAQRMLGDFQSAVGNFERSLALSRALDDKVMLANNYNNLGAAYNQLGDRAQALRYYTQTVVRLVFARLALRDAGQLRDCVDQLVQLNRTLRGLEDAGQYFGERQSRRVRAVKSHADFLRQVFNVTVHVRAPAPRGGAAEVFVRVRLPESEVRAVRQEVAQARLEAVALRVLAPEVPVAGVEGHARDVAAEVVDRTFAVGVKRAQLRDEVGPHVAEEFERVLVLLAPVRRVERDAELALDDAADDRGRVLLDEQREQALPLGLALGPQEGEQQHVRLGCQRASLHRRGVILTEAK